MKLILASASPRRADILRNAGLQFDILPADVDETRSPAESAQEYVRRLANEKVRSVAKRVANEGNQTVIVAADTVVALDSHVMGKPSSIEDARWMLRTLSAQTHQVFTGLALIGMSDRRETSHVEMTKVTFAALSEAEIETYLASGEPFDKAGAYGIQGIGGRYVTRIEGCYFNVMGLPLSRLWSALCSFGWQQMC
jgi:septum formation protein